MTEVGAILISAIIGGAIGIIGAVIGNRMSRSTTLAAIKITEFNKAAAVFKNTFLPEIVYLKYNAALEEISGHTDDITGLLKSGYTRRHLGAFETFQAILSPKDRQNLQKIWDEYCHPEGIPECEDTKRDHAFNDYSRIQESSDQETTKKIALEKINNILKFADFK